MRIFLRFVKKIFEDAEVHVYKKKIVLYVDYLRKYTAAETKT